MASWDSPDLLSQFNQLTGRDMASDEISDSSKYARLARAQLDVIGDIAGIYPQCLYKTTGPSATTTSGGIVHTFGNDSQGNAIAPLGQVWIGRNTRTYPDPDLLEGIDYINEGTQIRMVNERVENTLYWHGITSPTDIASGQAAAIRPAAARRLIVLKAAETFGREGGRDYALADDMANVYAREFAKWMLVFRTQFRAGGVLGPVDPWGGATKTLR